MNKIKFLLSTLFCLVNAYIVSANKCTASALPPDPKSDCCGVDAIVGSRFLGNKLEEIQKDPWLALVEYVKDDKVKTLCGGSLISGKHVLTAAHCVVGPVLRVGNPTHIRFGEYDTGNEGPDCIEVGNEKDCNDGAIRIPVRKTIPHPEYDPTHMLKRNDIALIEMTEMAPYTAFIRPICLPTRDITLNANNLNLILAGWGTAAGPSSTKLRLELPFVPKEICQPVYTPLKLTLWKGQICAGGEKGKDSCKGDGGLPLVYYNGTYELVGIVSFGKVPCGTENVPGIYTNVFEYVSWIKSNIAAS